MRILEDLAVGGCWTLPVLSCGVAAGTVPAVRDQLFAFPQHVEIMPFDVCGLGHHLRDVVGYVDVAAGKDVGRSRRELDHQGCRRCRGDIFLVGEGVDEPLLDAGFAAGQR